MAVDKKISQLTSLAQVDVSASTDVLPIVDTSATETKKITVSALVGAGATAGISGAVLTNGTINSTTIGATTPSTGAFTTLSASGAVSLNPANANVSLAPTGTGVVTINPATAGTMNNVAIGGSSAAAGTFTSATVSTGNLTFSSTAQRITGDMSNATIASRLAFQTSTTNGATDAAFVPNGTGSISRAFFYNQSDLSSGNLSANWIGSTSTEFSLRAAIHGTGTYLPMTFYTGGSERMRLDTSGNLGIGTASPGSRLHVATSAAEIARYASSAANGGYQIFYPDNGVTPVYVGSQKAILATGNATDFAIVGTGANNMVFGTNSAERMRIDSSGNVGIGTASPASKFNVGGGRSNFGANSEIYSIAVGYTQARCNAGQTYYIGATDSATPDLVFSNAAGTERMRVDTSGNVGIGGTADAYAKTQIKGNLPASGGTSVSYDTQAVITSSATSSAIMYESFPSVQNASFTLPILYHFIAAQGTKGASATVTNQYGFFAGSSLTGATNNFGFYSDIASGSNRWNFYANGTANNYFAGGTGIGVLPTGYTNYRLSVQNTGATSAAVFISDTSGTQTTFIWNQATSGDNVFTQFGTDGGATVRGSISYNRVGGLVAYNTTSDYRAKDVFGTWDDAGATIDALKVYRGKMHDATLERPMMIAHEAQAVVPYAVSGEKDAVDKDGKPVYQQMDHQVLVPLLIAELQAVRVRLAALEAK